MNHFLKFPPMHEYAIDVAVRVEHVTGVIRVPAVEEQAQTEWRGRIPARAEHTRILMLGGGHVETSMLAGQVLERLDSVLTHGGRLDA